MFTTQDTQNLVDQSIKKCTELMQNKREKEAEVVLKQVLRVDNENIDAQQLLGLIYYKQRKYQEAIDIFAKTLVTDPNNAASHNNIALCYGELGQFDHSINHLQMAIKTEPNNHNFWNNLGMQTRSAGDLQAALCFFEKSTEKNPNDAKIWLNIGSTYGQCKDLANAERCLNKAIELDQTFGAAHVNLAYCYHLQKKWQQAWQHYEWRFNYFEQLKKWTNLYPIQKSWNSSDDLTDKTIVFWCEQGMGDVIMFTRFLDHDKFKRAHKIIHTYPELISLLENLPFPITVTASRVKDYDYHVSMMSLPYLLGENGHNHVYLLPAMRTRLPATEKKYKVGIVWAGSPSHPNDFERSVMLNRFRILENIENIQLYSFQKDTRPRFYTATNQTIDFTTNSSEMNIIHMGDKLDNFEKTAEYLLDLNLLITVDTAMLHLAGAMGRPTIAIIPYNPDWRWGLTDDNTEWYPSVTLLRQEHKNDWDAVFAKLPELVKELLCTSTTASATKAI